MRGGMSFDESQYRRDIRDPVAPQKSVGSHTTPLLRECWITYLTGTFTSPEALETLVRGLRGPLGPKGLSDLWNRDYDYSVYTYT